MNPISAWNRFLFGPISARPLGAFRIVFGLLLLVYLAVMSVEFDYWYTDAGLLQGSEAREAAGPYRLSPLNYIQDPTIAHLFYAGTVAAAVGVTLGWRTRFMSVLLYLGMLSLYHRNVTGNGGPDAVPMLVSFYLMLCPSGAAFSLDAIRAAKKRGTAAEPLIVPWGLRLLQMQICLIYFQSCVIKCGGADLDERHCRTLHPVQSRVWPVQYGMAGAVPPPDQHDDAWRSFDRVRPGLLALVPSHSAVGDSRRSGSPSGHSSDSQCAGLRRRPWQRPIWSSWHPTRSTP